MSIFLHDPRRPTLALAFATCSLARSAGFIFALIAFFTVSCAGYVYIKVQQERSIEVANPDFDQSGSDLSARMMAEERQIRSDVYQAQQFLVDALGANDPKHLTDALSGMQALAAQFASEIADAKGVAETYGGPDLVAVYSDIEQRFGEYHARSSAIGKAHQAQALYPVDPREASFGKLGHEIQVSLDRIGPALDVVSRARFAKSAAANQKIDALREDTMMIALASCIINSLACLMGVVAVRKWVAQPLKSLIQCFSRLATGDVRQCDVAADRGDEIGDLRRTYDDFRQLVLEAHAARDKAREQEEVIESERNRAGMEKARLDEEQATSVRTMVDLVEKETNAAVTGLIDLMDHMTEIASDMSGAADRLGSTTDSVSAASEQALASMQTASSSSKELIGSIEGVAGQIRDAKAISDEAVLASRRACKSIEALSKVATEIDGVTELIANITRQTALLALNAGVEAARAGTEGQGFAIIAREIRLLADQTSDATNKIGGLIREVQGSTVSAVAAVDDISKAIDRVSRSSESMTDAIKTQVGTTRVIAKNVDGTTLAVTDVTTQIQNVADEVQGARTMSRNVEDVCTEASEKVWALKRLLVKTMRTSSGAANRRTRTRYEMNSAATIEFAGKVARVKIVDISEGGARLLGEIDASVRNFALRLPGMNKSLQCRVALYKDGVIRAIFEASTDEQAQLRMVLNRLDASGARKLAEAAA